MSPKALNNVQGRCWRQSHSLPMTLLGLALALLLTLLTVPHAVDAYSDSLKAKPSSSVLTRPLFLNITSPPILAAPIAYVPAWGGSSLPLPNRPDGSLEMPVMLPHISDQIAACTQPWRKMNEFNQSFAGSWILVQYSTCSATNFLYASMSGAAGILVYGCPTESPYNCDPSLKYAVSAIPLAAEIPMISVAHDDGIKIVNYLQALRASGTPLPSPSPISIRMQSTGPILPAERAALVAIMQQTIMLGLGSGQIPESLPVWSLARFTDPNIDACRNNTMGIWCEDGRIVYISVPYHGWSNNNQKTLPKEFGVLTKLRFLGLDTNAFAGTVPDEWCSLTELKSLLLSGNSITSLPSCIGQWQNMQELALETNRLTTLPAGISTLKHLVWLTLQQNAFSSLPDLSGLQSLQVLNVGGNAITGPFPALSPQAPLVQIGLASNMFSGPITAGVLSAYASTLQVLDVNHNYFSGALPPMDGFTQMTVIDLSSQRGTPLDSTRTGFTGQMPIGWNSFIYLKKLYLQENSFTGPFLVSNMLSLQYLDLSNNLITAATMANPNNNDVGILMYDLTSPAMVSLRLSHNKLTGPLTTGNYVLLSTFNQLFIDHNQITALPRELLLSAIRTFDASYNNLTNPYFYGAPPVDFLLFNVQGNPFFQLDPTQPLPTWMVVDDERVQQKDQLFACATLSSSSAPLMAINVDATFYSYRYCVCQSGTFGAPPLCAAVPDFAILNPTRVIASSQLGSEFPDLITRTGGLGGDLFASSLNATASAQSTQYSQAISDSMYGSTQRLTVGMSTSWVFDLSDLYSDDLQAIASQQQGLSSTGKIAATGTQRNTYQSNSSIAGIPPTWTPVHVITVRLHLNLDSFNLFEDQIAVYEGGSDLLGNRDLLLRGTSDLRSVTYSDYASTADYLARYNASLSQLGNHTSLIEVRVFSPIATVQFTSRALSGTHFYATYTYDFDCPDGYFYDTTRSPPQCRVNRILFHVGDGIRSAVYSVAAVAMAFVVLNLVTLCIFWHYPVYKAASRAFMLLTLIFLLCMSLGALLYAAVPSAGTTTGAAICNGRAWLSCLPLAGILGVILAKSNRLNSIFGSTTLQVKAMTDAQIARTVLTVCVIQIAMLCIFSGLPLSRPVRDVGKGSLSDELVDSCSQESGFMSWIGAEIAYIGCLMLPAAYLGFKTRDLPSQFNESAHIQNAIVLLIFFGVIIVPLDIFIEDNPEAAVLIQGLGQAFLTIILTAIIFLPKIYYLHFSVTKQPARANSGQNGTMIDTVNSFSNQATVPPGAKPPKAATHSGGKVNTPSHTPHPYPITNVPRVSSVSTKQEGVTPSITTKRLSTDLAMMKARTNADIGGESRPTSPANFFSTPTQDRSHSNSKVSAPIPPTPVGTAGAIIGPPPTILSVSSQVRTLSSSNSSNASNPMSSLSLPMSPDMRASPRRKLRVHTTAAGSVALEEMVQHHHVSIHSPTAAPPAVNEETAVNAAVGSSSTPQMQLP